MMVNFVSPLRLSLNIATVDALTPPTIEIVGFLGGAARFIAKP